MTELEFLKAESGLTDDEWKAMEAVSGSAKILTAIKKAMGLSDQALKDKVSAENERLAFEKRYNDEFVPEMRKVTTDALSATARAAAAEGATRSRRASTASFLQRPRIPIQQILPAPLVLPIPTV